MTSRKEKLNLPEFNPRRTDWWNRGIK